MAKKVILDVLESTIGKYVRNLDAESLNVAVWSGKIKLQSLELDVDAVNAELDRQAAEAPNFALPVRVTAGSFVSFEVDVPWARITSQPVVFRARGLKVFAEPYDRASKAVAQVPASVPGSVHEGNSEQKRRQKVEEQRMVSIKSHENYRQQANALKELTSADDQADGGKEQNNSAFTARISRRIAENLQVEIDDVRVELKGYGCAAGILLESLSLVTTDSAGNRTFVDRTKARKDQEASFLYKALKIKGLGIYLDEEETKVLSRKTESPHTYILAPLSFEARLRQSDDVKCVHFPKYQLSSELSQLSILLSKTQLELGHKLTMAVTPTDAARPIFPDYRPLSRLSKSTAREWWRYAYRCVGRLNGKRSWVEFIIAFRKRKAYIPLYKRAAHASTCQWISPLSEEEKLELEGLEKDRTISVEGLMTWRNLADAQVSLERERHDATRKKPKRGTVLSSFFGSKSNNGADEETPPIVLSVDEMKELEAISLDQTSDAELTTDSMLCDVAFTLGSFKINLSTYGMKPIVALEMGQVTTSFNANVDGSYSYELFLTSLTVKDAVTPRSLFPDVIRNLPSKGDDPSREQAFRFRLGKEKNGDQQLTIRLVAFQLVASPLLFKEIKNFFDISRGPAHNTWKDNKPFLAQSVSGSVDLFYDATEGYLEKSLKTSPESLTDEDGVLADRLSLAMAEAWKSKTKEKVAWTIDCDLQAPVIVIPESCVDHSAHVVVFDLGHLRFRYGSIEAAPFVQQWFHENESHGSNRTSLESALLSVEQLTFVISTSHTLATSDFASESQQIRSAAVIEPLSCSLDIGIEAVSGIEKPRLCVVGVVPSVVLSVSPMQISAMFSVAKKWKEFFVEIRDNPVEEEREGLTIIEEEPDVECRQVVSSSSDEAQNKNPTNRDGPSFLPIVAEPGKESHFSISLQRLSLYARRDQGDFVEAHLVSVSLSMTQFADSTTQYQMMMGWFWILDHLNASHRRRQRLIIHSDLPRTAAEFAQDEQYDVLGSLEQLGVFRKDFEGSSDLADIVVKTEGFERGIGNTASDLASFALHEPPSAVHTFIDATFASLVVNWNPHAVKELALAVDDLTAAVVVSPFYSGGLALDAPKKKLVSSELKKSTLTVLKAGLRKIEMSLNSAKDDLPLYIATMSETKVAMVALEDSDPKMKASLELGDLRVETIPISSTNPEFKTLLGISPGAEASLLTVDYFVGGKPDHADFSPIEANDGKCEAWANVGLSPMRLVYVQAQVLTLMDYITEGILGNLTAQAATSAVSAAKEITAPSKGDKIFVVKAVGFDILIPESLNVKTHFLIRTGDLTLNYHLLSVGGGKAAACLHTVLLTDSHGSRMVEEPIQLLVDICMPADDVGSLDDQAMSVDVQISKASFLLSKAQYRQLFGVLDRNVGENNPMLREASQQDVPDPSRSGEAAEDAIVSSSNVLASSMTHAGIEFVEKTRRIKIQVLIELLSLETFASRRVQPIVRLTAENGCVQLGLKPDEEEMRITLTLRNLICDDLRHQAVGRQFNCLVDQSSSGGNDRDVFFLSYEDKKRSHETTVELKIGAPQIVFVPDAIADALEFLSRSDMPLPEKPSDQDDKVQILIGSDGCIETPLTHAVASAKLSLSMQTSLCRIVLVDLGSSILESNMASRKTQKNASESRTSESMVLQGQFDGKLAIESGDNFEDPGKVDVEIHGQKFEVYSAHGKSLRNPLQILEPTSFAILCSYVPWSGKAADFDIRAVALASVDLTCSMQNAALLMAILSSFSDSLQRPSLLESELEEYVPLSGAEAERIEKLAIALERQDSEIFSDKASVRDLSSVDDSSHRCETETTELSSSRWRVKVTLPSLTLTLVNDLQGCDEALFRISTSNFVAGMEATNGILLSTHQITFDLHVNSSITANYYDSSVNLWKRLLEKPWELTLKSSRGVSPKYKSNRLSTTMDVESYPCHLTFSEQFLISLGKANRMWTAYVTATQSALGGRSETEDRADRSNLATRKALAANAARNLVVSLPYAIENHCGENISFSCHWDDNADEKRYCENGTIQYFRFDAPRENGVGGKRLYGQEVSRLKLITLLICQTEITIRHIDGEVGLGRRAHTLREGGTVITEVSKDGNSTVLHLCSPVEVHNLTSINFRIGTRSSEEFRDFGICRGRESSAARAPLVREHGAQSRRSRRCGVPIDLLHSNPIENTGAERLSLLLVIIPTHPHGEELPLEGDFALPSVQEMLLETAGDHRARVFDVTCRASDPGSGSLKRADPFVVQIRFHISLVENKYPFLDVFMKPRAVIENRMPVQLLVRTPMPYTFTVPNREKQSESGMETLHTVAPRSSVEVFSPSASVAIGVKCADQPIGGGITGWMQGDWVELPMVPEFRLPEPLRCVLPFESSKSSLLMGGSGTAGIEFFVVDGAETLSRLSLSDDHDFHNAADVELYIPKSVQEESMRSYFLTVCNYGIDHIGGILFEQLMSRGVRKSFNPSDLPSLRRTSVSTPTATPFSSFSSSEFNHRVSLLPGASTPLRLLYLTMDGDEGLRRSLPFRVEDVAISEGGVDTTPIRWEDHTDSGFFAYRKLVDSYQSEVHIVPEFVVFNGGRHKVLVRQQCRGGPATEQLIPPGQIASMWRVNEIGLILSMYYIDVGGFTPWMRMDDLNHKVALVRSVDQGVPLGSLACQTVIGSQDSRFVVKLGDVKFGISSDSEVMDTSRSFFTDDFVRIRFRWTNLQLTLNETRPLDLEKEGDIAFVESALDKIMEKDAAKAAKSKPHKSGKETWSDARRNREVGLYDESRSQRTVCTVILTRLTMDWQKVFKEDSASLGQKSALLSPERSQLSMIIHNIRILDNTTKSKFPVVLDSTSSTSFFDLCIRTRGPLDADLIKVDLFDVNLCHANGRSNRITLKTSEDFVWKILDVVDRILVATVELAGADMVMEWDEEQEDFIISLKANGRRNDEADNRYCPPQSTTLFDINKARVSPFAIEVTFQRQPQASRYRVLRNVRGAKVMNYFTTRLKFTLDKAELKFSRYEASNLKGPVERLWEVLGAVYIARTKLKIVSIISAASFQDWKFLASRDEGDDSFVEGDVLRVAGNAAGSTANFVLKKVGSGLGDGVSHVSSAIGDGIENATDMVGARVIGAGVNSVVSGFGGGVGDTVKGVGSGAGKVLKGAGKGVGHVVGGVTGAALLVGKGIGKGVSSGDGKAVLSGLAEGAVSIGTGVGQGVESTVIGAADGVLTAGKGLFSGVKNVGKGIGGAFTGGKQSKRRSKRGLK